MADVQRVFIGSSTTGRLVAQALESRLRPYMQCRLWFKGSFTPSRTIMEDLERIARSEVDVAVLVLTPDDVRDRGRGLHPVPRDNVLFELGLFMGSLGRHKTFGLKCGHCAMDVPSDLLGVTWLDYEHPHELEDTGSAEAAALMDRLASAVGQAAEDVIRLSTSVKPEPVRTIGSPELIKAYPMRGLVTRPAWNDIISDSKHHLWLYGMAELGYAEDDQVPDIIRTAAANGSDIRILLLDPSYPEIARIDVEEENPPGTISARIRASLARFHRISASCNGLAKIRLYNHTPAVSIVRGDDHILVTPYVRFIAGNNTPTFELERTEVGGIFDRYTKHFYETWKFAKDFAG